MDNSAKQVITSPYIFCITASIRDSVLKTTRPFDTVRRFNGSDRLNNLSMVSRIVFPATIRRPTLGYVAFGVMVLVSLWVGARAQNLPFQATAAPGAQGDGT